MDDEENDKESLNSDEEDAIRQKHNEELEDIVRKYEDEKTRLYRDLEKLEKNSKSIIDDLESQISNLKMEARSLNEDKDQLEHFQRRESVSSNVLLVEIEGLQEKVRELELLKDQEEQKHMDVIYDLKNSMMESDDQKNTLKKKIEKLEKKIETLKENKEKLNQELEEYRNKLIQKEKELANNNSKNEVTYLFLSSDFNDFFFIIL